MIINIILPGSARYPIGGFKIIFEYANGLSRRGHKINITIPLVLEISDMSFIKKLKLILIYHREKLFKYYKPDTWFNLEPGININWVMSLKEESIPAGEILIATSWHTAHISNNYSSDKGKKYYFIQSVETWHGEYTDVIGTWKMPFEKIVISKWLLDFASSIDQTATLIYNGFDFNSFGIDIKPEDRSPFKIAMLYHDMEVKGSIYGINAFIDLKKEYPMLDVTLFGVSNKPVNIPDWINYVKNPSQKKLRILYNQNSIYVSPSIMEGFALTPPESMMCGCAVVVSDIGGHQDYAISEKTALLFVPKDSDSLRNEIKRLLEDNEFRIKMAYRGNEFIKKFDVIKSINLFEKTLLEKRINNKN